MSKDSFSWGADDYAKAKRLWAEGASAAVIGRAFKVSRNAVLGLAHRHRADFPARRDGASPSGKVRPVRAPGPGDVRTGSKEAKPKAARNPVAVRDSAPRRERAPLPEGRADWLRQAGDAICRDLSKFRRDEVEPVAFAGLRASQCHFPLSAFDEKCGPSTPCCGAPVAHGSYCAAHLRLSVRRIGG